MGVLEALVRAHRQRVGWTLSDGMSGVRHSIDLECLPKPSVAEFSTRTKDRSFLCIEVMPGRLVPLLAPCGSAGRTMAKDLILRGAHPLDVIIAIQDDAGEWVFKNSVECMFWTHEDQKRLARTSTDA